MGKQFVLHTQLPKPKVLGLGVLSVAPDGDAHFFGGDGGSGAPVLAELARARIEHAAAHGIMLSGMQPGGFERDGRQKYSYQAWWLRYVESNS